MFNENEIQSYRKMKAPADLKEKVLSRTASTVSSANDTGMNFYRKYGKGIAAIAACFTILITAFFLNFSGNGTPVITFEGETLSEEGVPVLPAGVTNVTAGADTAAPTGDLLLARMTPEEPLLVSIDIESDSSSRYLVNQGAMEITDKKTKELVFQNGTSYEYDGDVNIRWSLMGIRGETYLLQVSAKEEVYNIRVVYDEEKETWMISKTTKN